MKNETWQSDEKGKGKQQRGADNRPEHLRQSQRRKCKSQRHTTTHKEERNLQNKTGNAKMNPGNRNEKRKLTV